MKTFGHPLSLCGALLLACCSQFLLTPAEGTHIVPKNIYPVPSYDVGYKHIDHHRYYPAVACDCYKLGKPYYPQPFKPGYIDYPFDGFYHKKPYYPYKPFLPVPGKPHTPFYPPYQPFHPYRPNYPYFPIYPHKPFYPSKPYYPYKPHYPHSRPHPYYPYKPHYPHSRPHPYYPFFPNCFCNSFHYPKKLY